MGCLACVWLAAAPPAARGATSKIPVRQVDLGYAVGQTGLKVRLGLAGGQAVEYQVADAREADSVLRMVEMFLAGQAQMFAELDGNNAVRGVQIAGPISRTAR
jgi:hypothetical protein